ncbi:MAG: alpha/beta hydrolase, partial [Ferruginibacter sp.]
MKYFLMLMVILSPCLVYPQTVSGVSQTELIYGRKDGMALTMFVQVPGKSPNGRGIIVVESGNWRSSYERAVRFLKGSAVYTDQGYAVFTVLPSSQPRYTIPDEINDLKRAVRFIRYHAKDYGIDGDHIGLTGFSSGGHLSLAVATADDKIDSASIDPVDRVSSRVQAVAVFYPPTDFLNFGKQDASPTTIRKAL